MGSPGLGGTTDSFANGGAVVVIDSGEVFGLFCGAVEFGEPTATDFASAAGSDFSFELHADKIETKMTTNTIQYGLFATKTSLLPDAVRWLDCRFCDHGINRKMNSRFRDYRADWGNSCKTTISG